jgi:hypothetical protein
MSWEDLGMQILCNKHNYSYERAIKQPGRRGRIAAGFTGEAIPKQSFES